jgi:hypothetical protein
MARARLLLKVLLLMANWVLSAAHKTDSTPATFTPVKLLYDSSRGVLPHTVIRQPGLLQLLLKVMPSARDLRAASDLSTPTVRLLLMLVQDQLKDWIGLADPEPEPRTLTTQ